MIRPQGASTVETSAPARRATSAKRPPNTPLTPTTTRSPGSTRLTTTASRPALPVPDTGKVTRLPVRKIARSCSAISSRMGVKSGSRWPSSGWAMAARTEGWTSLGPGPSRIRSGGYAAARVCALAAGPACGVGIRAILIGGRGGGRRPMLVEGAHLCQRVGVRGNLVVAVAAHAGETQRHAARVARAGLHAVDGHLDHLLRAHVHDMARAGGLQIEEARGLPLQQLVGEALEGLAEHHERPRVVRVAGAEVEVGQPAPPPTGPPLDREHHQVQGVHGLDLAPGRSSPSRWSRSKKNGAISTPLAVVLRPNPLMVSWRAIGRPPGPSARISPSSTRLSASSPATSSTTCGARPVASRRLRV